MYQEWFKETDIKKIPLFDTSLVKSMSNFFYNCQMLEEIPLKRIKKKTKNGQSKN